MSLLRPPNPSPDIEKATGVQVASRVRDERTYPEPKANGTETVNSTVTSKFRDDGCSFHVRQCECFPNDDEDEKACKARFKRIVEQQKACYSMFHICETKSNQI
jgi:hypothetical protein